MKRTLVPRKVPDLYERELGPFPPARWWIETHMAKPVRIPYGSVTGESHPWWEPDFYRGPFPGQRQRQLGDNLHLAVGLDRDGGTARWLAAIWETPDENPDQRARRRIDSRAPKRPRRGQLTLGV